MRESLVSLHLVLSDEVLRFSSAEQLLETRWPSHAGCLIADMRLPGLKGMQLLEELSERGFSSAAILITGHGDSQMLRRIKKFPDTYLFEKPYAPDEFIACVRTILIKRANAENT